MEFVAINGGNDMEWINVVISILAGVGGVSGLIALYNAKSNKDTIDISNFHSLIEEERTERTNLRKEFDEYKLEVHTRVDAVKKEIADMRMENQKMVASIYSAYRCHLPANVETDCPVLTTFKNLDCAGCKYNEEN